MRHTATLTAAFTLTAALLLSGCPRKRAEIEASGGAEEPQPAILPTGSALVQKKGRSTTVPLQGAEWVHSGDHVDILTYAKDPQTGESMVMTVLQNSVVLDVGPLPPPSSERPTMRQVTLLLLPEEAEILLVALQTGVATAAVRSSEDIDLQEERGRATLSTLFTGERINTLLRKRGALLAPRREEGQ